MRDNLAGRVGRIISGSCNALIDAVENSVPETVMEEAIREIDGAIDEVRADLGLVAANKHLANSRLLDENAKHEDLSGKIEMAVNENRDDLAEAAIASQLDIEAQIPILEATIGECANQEKELEGYISALQAKKREMKNELKQFRESRQEASTISGSGKASATTGVNVESRVSKAESAFERVVENTTGLMARTGTGDKNNAAKLAELEDMSHQQRIKARLAAVKKEK